ncbi:DNA ligase [Thiolapillus sp.]|uniref:DNA ligase n=4 Tax=Thiolapillus sp. TaxID=2017437 RepID=UPI0025D9096D|nr:DNA ligase [Thiolapillus sp.]
MMESKGYRLHWLFLLLLLVTPATGTELLLLTKYRPGMVIDGWLMSEKLDGVRAYWDGSRLLSRQGNPFAVPDWFIQDLPPFELDGELWIARGQFEQTLSIVSRNYHDPEWRRITYRVFEVPHASGGLLTRLHKLEAYLKEHPLEHVSVIPQSVCRDTAHLMEKLDAVVAAGGEGLVLREPGSPYETGRSRHALKVKRYDDMEGRVLGYRPGKGKFKGMVGALQVEIEGGKRFYIGTGLSDQDRRDPPAIGSLITFRYHGLSSAGIPRFASFMRVREQPSPVPSSGQ